MNAVLIVVGCMTRVIPVRNFVFRTCANRKKAWKNKG